MRRTAGSSFFHVRLEESIFFAFPSPVSLEIFFGFSSPVFASVLRVSHFAFGVFRVGLHP